MPPPLPQKTGVQCPNPTPKDEALRRGFGAQIRNISYRGAGALILGSGEIFTENEG